MDSLARNQQNAMAFYGLMLNQNQNQNQPALAVERYVGATYIPHNPHVAES